MEKISDMKFVEWYREKNGQRVHPVTARKTFWEDQTKEKYIQLGIDSPGNAKFRDIHFATAVTYVDFDNAVISFQEAENYSTNRSTTLYKNGDSNL